MLPKKIYSALLVTVFLLVGVIPALAQDSANCETSIPVWDNDTLTSLAAQNNVTVDSLARVNGLSTNARLRIGDRLCLTGTTALANSSDPVAQGGAESEDLEESVEDGAEDAAEDMNDTSGDATDDTVTTTTTTSAGDNTGGATQAEEVEDIAEDAAESDPPIYVFRRGQLNLPDGYSIYTVQADDNLFAISREVGVPLNTLAQVNNIRNVNVVYFGESLLIPGDTTAPRAGNAVLGTGGATTPNNNSNANANANANNNANATANNNANAGTGGQAASGVFQPAAGTIPVVQVPRRAQPGDTITVSGSNYPGLTDVEIFAERKSLGLISDPIKTVTTEEDGTFSTSITVPTEFANGVAVDGVIVSISAYTEEGGYWGMNYFVNGE